MPRVANPIQGFLIAVYMSIFYSVGVKEVFRVAGISVAGLSQLKWAVAVETEKGALKSKCIHVAHCYYSVSKYCNIGHMRDLFGLTLFFHFYQRKK